MHLDESTVSSIWRQYPEYLRAKSGERLWWAWNWPNECKFAEKLHWGLLLFEFDPRQMITWPSNYCMKLVWFLQESYNFFWGRHKSPSSLHLKSPISGETTVLLWFSSSPAACSAYDTVKETCKFCWTKLVPYFTAKWAIQQRALQSQQFSSDSEIGHLSSCQSIPGVCFVCFYNWVQLPSH